MCFVNINLCHLQHKLIGFITEMKSVYSAVRTGSLNEAVCAPSLKGRKKSSVMPSDSVYCVTQRFDKTKQIRIEYSH
jgi:hypothetical protein